MNLLIEELPADLVLPGQLGDRFSPGEHLDGQPLPLLRRQLLSRTRNMNSCRSWPVKRSRSRSGITLRDRDRQSSLTIHVCFLHETQFVRTNNANMEEAGILEKITRSGFCYPALNQVRTRIGPGLQKVNPWYIPYVRCRSRTAPSFHLASREKCRSSTKSRPIKDNWMSRNRALIAVADQSLRGS